MGPLFVFVVSLIAPSARAQGLEPSVSGDLTLTEFMAEPADPIAAYNGEWFEVRNNSGRRLDLTGVRFTSTSGGGFIVRTTLLVEDTEYLVFGVNNDLSLNGGVTLDYVYPFDDLTMNHTGDTFTIEYDGITLDTVTWGSTVGWEVPATNETQQVSPNAEALEWANDLDHNWCDSSDFFGAIYATPGAQNEYCTSGSADFDNDGYTLAAGDCDDQDDYVNPAALDGNRDPYGNPNDDANCDGVRDDGTIDDDNDGSTEQSGDCDDSDPSRSPSEVEETNNVDDDCNGCVDDVDIDEDSFTTCDNGLVIDCSEDDGVQCGDTMGVPIDFDLTNADFFESYLEGSCAYAVDPAEDDEDRYACAPEVPYDGIDQSGDGYDACDLDRDGFASEDCPNSPDPGWRVLDFDREPLPRDCDDANANVFPGGDEGDPDRGGIPDGEDNDCNGVVDDPYLDLDGDGFTMAEGDCRDADPEIDPEAAAMYPGASEICGDGIDNDCNGFIDDMCDIPTATATLGGGGMCGLAPATGGVAALSLTLVALARRRRTSDDAREPIG
ncbi:MAG: hypothetical protein CL927_12805 [Deltaproteobacteria bacterium]|nr:hypothetical protein [Deltaproteobacteria bacterium]HCH63732.1 hypothetical protein [Deltaproteobacteria bacterium]